jgi:hypothetical protein
VAQVEAVRLKKVALVEAALTQVVQEQQGKVTMVATPHTPLDCSKPLVVVVAALMLLV